MNAVYKNMLERLNIKKEEYNKKLYHFKIMVENESGTGCFERNAINDLLVMDELKAEIEELDRMVTLLEIQIKK
mgnify:FL=1